MAADFAAFESAARAQGYDEVLVRDWAPLAVIDTHTHPFAVNAIVVAGEMWLTQGGETHHLRPGDRFTLGRDEPHAERYGAAGASYWVARRN
jgi:quercetin dioxygenase-like cupin family protein